jgi:epoxyqueuosine reductase
VNIPFPSDRIKQYAFEAGFNLAGITKAEPSPHLDAYLRWIDAGMQGSMGYMARPDRQARRRDLNVILPGAQSLILVGLDYRQLDVPETALSDPARGRIASYAWGLDYHDLMTPRLEALADRLASAVGEAIGHKVYVDTGAILERSHAHEAGMGFTGKNTMLIHPRRGSYFFLGEIITDLRFDRYDTPGHDSMCGSCTRCLVACPTDAFPRPFVLDARRCISYLTIEHKGAIDPALRPLMGNWVFGCDVCQDVCPWQRFTEPTGEAAFVAGDLDRAAPPLLDLLTLDAAGFRAQFGGSPVERIKRGRLVRNACVAAGNWGDRRAVEPLRALLDDAEPVVRSHAGWALRRILGGDATAALRAAFQREDDADARAEFGRLLG